MARETYRESQIQTPTQTPVYQDQEQIVRRLGSHLGEMFAGQVTGAGGAGGDLEGIPFEPAAVLVYNLDAGTPFAQFAPPQRLGTAAEQLNIGAAAGPGSAAIPAGVKQEDGTWTLSLPTAIAGDGDVVEVIVWGFRDVGGSL